MKRWPDGNRGGRRAPCRSRAADFNAETRRFAEFAEQTFRACSLTHKSENQASQVDVLWLRPPARQVYLWLLPDFLMFSAVCTFGRGG